MKQTLQRFIVFNCLLLLLLYFGCSQSIRIESESNSKNHQNHRDDKNINVQDDVDDVHPITDIHDNDDDNIVAVNHDEDENTSSSNNKAEADFVSSMPELLMDNDVQAMVYFSPYDDTRNLVIKELEQAQKSVSLVFYNLRDDTILQTLKKLHEKKVLIKVYLDEYQAELSYNTFDDELRHADIEVNTILVGNAENSSMHNKFAIIDEKTVLTGTMNWSTTSFDENYEHFFKITNQVIVKQFLQVFENIEKKSDNIVFDSDTDNFAVYFAPYESLLPVVTETLQKASKSVFLVMYHLNQPELIQEIINAHKRGVKVIVVLDSPQQKQENSDEDLIAQGISVFLVTLPNEFSRMHEKAVIIDNETVVAGSYNWTSLASFHNYETLLKITDTDIANAFLSQMFHLLNDLAKNEFDPSKVGLSVSSIPITITLKDIPPDPQKKYFLTGDVASLGKWNIQKAVSFEEKEQKLQVQFKNVPGSPIHYKVFYTSENMVWFEPGSLHKIFVPFTIDSLDMLVQLRE